jgi:predicted secreted acid phosphatase
MSQASGGSPAALEPFGRKYFVLPNPMYGSWQQ